MADKIFDCATHNFSTDDIKEWDKHCEKIEHEYDLHDECDCGKPIHVKPKQKLGLKAKRIPRGFKCEECKKKVIDAPEIKEGEKIINE